MTRHKMTKQKTKANSQNDFVAVALIAQELKVLFTRHGFDNLDEIYREALDMIATRIARILTENNFNHHHWKKITKYSAFAAEYSTNTEFVKEVQQSLFTDKV